MREPTKVKVDSEPLPSIHEPRTGRFPTAGAISRSAEVRRYRIVGVLGKGGFGIVYHAQLEGADGFVKDLSLIHI